MNSFELKFQNLSDEEILNTVAGLSDLVEDDYYATPLIAAISLDRVSLVRAMLERGVTPNQKTFLASSLGGAISSTHLNCNQILQLLLDRIGVIKEEDPFDFCGDLNEPMLHAAVRLRKLDAVCILLKHGVNPDWMDTDGVSALALAKECDFDEIYDVLKKGRC